MAKKLVFVYNADSGLFNTVSDIAHKIFSPSTYECNLCQLAYGNFSIKEEWASFVENAPFESAFLHRDEFVKAFPDVESDLPAVFFQEGENLVPCLGPDSINSCESLAELQSLIMSTCV